ncbi:MAG: outer membrane lipoprotein-sorting protein [Planctomycetota bacterium]|jgi:hypothetical protein
MKSVARTGLVCGAALLLAWAAPQPASSQDTPEETLTGRQIMEQVDKTNRSADEMMGVTMRLIKGKALMRTRELDFTVKTADKYEDKTLSQFTAPGDVRGTGFLTHQHGEGEDDMWMYVPSLKKTKRLAATERKDPFFGSDYAYEDLRTENLLAYEYKLMKKTHVKQLGLDCWVVEATPATEGEKRGSGYSARHLWISPDYLIRRIDYLVTDADKTTMEKSQFFSDYTTQDGWHGFQRATKAVMVHKKKGTRTEFEYHADKRKINSGITDDQVSQRALSQP